MEPHRLSSCSAAAVPAGSVCDCGSVTHSRDCGVCSANFVSPLMRSLSPYALRPLSFSLSRYSRSLAPPSRLACAFGCTGMATPAAASATATDSSISTASDSDSIPLPLAPSLTSGSVTPFLWCPPTSMRMWSSLSLVQWSSVYCRISSERWMLYTNGRSDGAVAAAGETGQDRFLGATLRHMGFGTASGLHAGEAGGALGEWRGTECSACGRARDSSSPRFLLTSKQVDNFEKRFATLYEKCDLKQ